MMLVQFVITFFNTAILVMLLTTNFSESKFGILRDYFSVGDQTDFS